MTYRGQNAKLKSYVCVSATEGDDSQDNSSVMTDADDTQLHTAESDDVL